MIPVNHTRDMGDDFVLREGRLRPGNAAVALLVLEDGRYLMQLRDQKPGIFFPGHWGLFGGALDLGETAPTALRRELREEIGIEVAALDYFTEFAFDFAPHGGGSVRRTYYEARLSDAQVAEIRLGEGAAFEPFAGADLFKGTRVTPYDLLAIWMHLTR